MSDTYYEVDVESARICDHVTDDEGNSHPVNRRRVYFFYAFRCSRYSNPETIVREKLMIRPGQHSSDSYVNKDDCERDALLWVNEVENNIRESEVE